METAENLIGNLAIPKNIGITIVSSRERIEELCQELDADLSIQCAFIDSGFETLDYLCAYIINVKSNVLLSAMEFQTEQEECTNALARDIDALMASNDKSISRITNSHIFNIAKHQKFVNDIRKATNNINAGADALENEYFALQEEITLWKQRIAEKIHRQTMIMEEKKRAEEEEMRRRKDEEERKKKAEEEEMAKKKKQEQERQQRKRSAKTPIKAVASIKRTASSQTPMGIDTDVQHIVQREPPTSSSIGSQHPKFAPPRVPQQINNNNSVNKKLKVEQKQQGSSIAQQNKTHRRAPIYYKYQPKDHNKTMDTDDSFWNDD